MALRAAAEAEKVKKGQMPGKVSLVRGIHLRLVPRTCSHRADKEYATAVITVFKSSCAIFILRKEELSKLTSDERKYLQVSHEALVVSLLRVSCRS
jgi:hypothetical protein